jgi:hypothetical protein
MDWYDNEDAGDLSAMGWADFSGHLGEEHHDGAHEDDPHPQCHECQGN